MNDSNQMFNTEENISPNISENQKKKKNIVKVGYYIMISLLCVFFIILSAAAVPPLAIFVIPVFIFLFLFPKLAAKGTAPQTETKFTKPVNLPFGSKALKEENEKLKAMLSPEAQDLVAIQKQLEDAKSQLSSTTAQITKNTTTIYNQEKAIKENNSQIINQNGIIEMQDYGLYTPTYSFANSDLYADRLKKVRETQKEAIKNGTACSGNMNWEVNGKVSLGKKMVKDMIKLLLRAYNLECDDIVRCVKISNIEKSKERIQKSAEQISKLGAIMSISINQYYVRLKLEELTLALEFEQVKADEKERIREERERQREEAKVQKEIEEKRRKLQREQEHYKNALAVIEAQLKLKPDDIDLLLKKAEITGNLEEILKAIENVDYREANKRAGYIYIISNIGAFGEGVYKIGMTRRLEPLDRVNELGDASVPFKFDVHALIFTDDAPALEAALHSAFEDKKINKINGRKEFFRVSLDDIKRVVRENFDKTVEWTDDAEAEQYRQSTLM